MVYSSTSSGPEIKLLSLPSIRMEGESWIYQNDSNSVPVGYNVAVETTMRSVNENLQSHSSPFVMSVKEIKEEHIYDFLPVQHRASEVNAAPSCKEEVCLQHEIKGKGDLGMSLKVIPKEEFDDFLREFSHGKLKQEPCDLQHVNRDVTSTTGKFEPT